MNLLTITLTVGLVAALAGCVNPITGNSVCNRNSVKDCKGEWTGTECGPRGRGFTCTDNGNGGILTPECSCLDGQGNPPQLEPVEVKEDIKKIEEA